MLRSPPSVLPWWPRMGALYFPEKQTAICAVVNQEGVDPGAVMGDALRSVFGP